MSGYARIGTYITPVVEGVCKHLSLRDSSGNLITTDDNVVWAARMAYSQVVDYLRAPLARASYTELFREVSDWEVYLSVRPVEELTTVEGMMDGEITWTSLTVDEDYYFDGDRIWLLPSSINTPTIKNLKVTYIGGRTDPKEEDHLILSALMMQAMANYNRRQAYGLATGVTVSGDTFSFVSNKGGLIEDVIALLSSRVVYGGGEILSAEDVV